MPRTKKVVIEKVERDRWDWFGQAGHFCGSDKCRYHLHTHVGKFCISTVGEYRPHDGEIKTLGTDGHIYETMVFLIKKETTNGRDIECMKSMDREDAADTHVSLCEKYGGLS